MVTSVQSHGFSSPSASCSQCVAESKHPNPFPSLKTRNTHGENLQCSDFELCLIPLSHSAPLVVITCFVWHLCKVHCTCSALFTYTCRGTEILQCKHSDDQCTKSKYESHPGKPDLRNNRRHEQWCLNWPPAGDQVRVHEYTAPCQCTNEQKHRTLVLKERRSRAGKRWGKRYWWCVCVFLAATPFRTHIFGHIWVMDLWQTIHCCSLRYPEQRPQANPYVQCTKVHWSDDVYEYVLWERTSVSVFWPSTWCFRARRLKDNNVETRTHTLPPQNVFKSHIMRILKLKKENRKAYSLDLLPGLIAPRSAVSGEHQAGQRGR